MRGDAAVGLCLVSVALGTAGGVAWVHGENRSGRAVSYDRSGRIVELAGEAARETARREAIVVERAEALARKQATADARANRRAAARLRDRVRAAPDPPAPRAGAPSPVRMAERAVRPPAVRAGPATPGPTRPAVIPERANTVPIAPKPATPRPIPSKPNPELIGGVDFDDSG